MGKVRQMTALRAPLGACARGCFGKGSVMYGLPAVPHPCACVRAYGGIHRAPEGRTRSHVGGPSAVRSMHTRPGIDLSLAEAVGCRRARETPPPRVRCPGPFRRRWGAGRRQRRGWRRPRAPRGASGRAGAPPPGTVVPHLLGGGGLGEPAHCLRAAFPSKSRGLKSHRHISRGRAVVFRNQRVQPPPPGVTPYTSSPAPLGGLPRHAACGGPHCPTSPPPSIEPAKG